MLEFFFLLCISLRQTKLASSVLALYGSSSVIKVQLLTSAKETYYFHKNNWSGVGASFNKAPPSSFCTTDRPAKTWMLMQWQHSITRSWQLYLTTWFHWRRRHRVRQSDPWYDDECRSAKRSARKLERRYKRTVKTSKQNPSVSASAQQARETWLHALKASHRLVGQKRRRFWRIQADTFTNPSRLCQTIDDRCRSGSL